MTHEAPKKYLTYEELTKWFLGIVATLLVVSFGWVFTMSREVATHEARLIMLETQISKALTRDEHLVFYNQVLSDLRDLKTEQSNIREILLQHEKDSKQNR